MQAGTARAPAITACTRPQLLLNNLAPVCDEEWALQMYALLARQVDPGQPDVRGQQPQEWRRPVLALQRVVWCHEWTPGGGR